MNKKPIATLYIDLDGVLADFATAFRSKFGDHYECSDGRVQNASREEIADLVKGTNLFATLPTFDSNEKILDYLRENWNFKILSSPMTGVEEESTSSKVTWVKKHLGEDVDAIIEKKKSKYATSGQVPNVLVDDWTRNIRYWQRAGGTAVLWRASEDTPEELIKRLEGIRNRLPKESTVSE